MDSNITLPKLYDIISAIDNKTSWITKCTLKMLVMRKGSSEMVLELLSLLPNDSPTDEDCIIARRSQGCLENKGDMKFSFYAGHPFNPIEIAVLDNDPRLIPALVSAGYSTDLPGHQMTALGFAALNGYEKVVEALLDAGVDANTPDENGGTPLYYAAGGNNENVVRLLLDKDADSLAVINGETIIEGVQDPSSPIAELIRQAMVRSIS